MRKQALNILSLAWTALALCLCASTVEAHSEEASLRKSILDAIEHRNRTKHNQQTAREDGCNICPATTTNLGSTLQITNNCGSTVTVYAQGYDPSGQPCTFGTGNPYQPNSPTCLQNIASGATATVKLISNSHQPGTPNGWGYNFWLKTTGTWFEITPGPTSMPGQTSQDNFDISFNPCPPTGCDIGMTLLTPEGSVVPKIVATPANAWTAPGAYPLGSNGCASQPCLSPTYSSPHGTFQLFLCNRPGDINTPGPCGCTQCTEQTCNPANQPPSGYTCTSSGGAYCLSPCPPNQAVCNGIPTLSGQNGCVVDCPSS